MKAGMWLDLRKAVIVLLEGDSERIFEIESEIEDYHVHGGYGGKNKGLPQDARSDKKFQARRELQTKYYFDKIMNNLPRLQKLYVFGPGEAKTQILTMMKVKAEFKDTDVVTKAAGQMTINQVRAMAQDFFATRSPITLMDEEVQVSNTNVTHEFVNMAVSEATKTVVNQKLDKLLQRYPWIVRAKAFYKLDKDPEDRNFVCEIELSVPGKNIFSKARADDMTKAIAETIEELRRQLRKRKHLQNG